jgi:hypothetical protein
MTNDRRRLDAIIGLAALGSAATGVMSLVVALFPLFSGEFLAAGICLLAAALSFGLLAIAVLR